jgi:hypothetical protein
MAMMVACSGSGPGSGSTGIDGTWDITQAGTASIGPSEMTVNGGAVSGYIASADEGKPLSDIATCIRKSDRTTFSMSVDKDQLTFTVTENLQYTGSGCPSNKVSTGTLLGTRTQKAADSDTQLNGTWSLTSQDTKNSFGAVSVDGLTAKAWGNPADLVAGKPATLTVIVTNGLASVSTSNANLSFAAKRR